MKKKEEDKERKEFAKDIRRLMKTEKGRKEISKTAKENIKSAFKIITEDEVAYNDNRVKKYLKNFEETMLFILTAASTDEIEMKEINNRFELLDL